MTARQATPADTTLPFVTRAAPEREGLPMFTTLTFATQSDTRALRTPALATARLNVAQSGTADPGTSTGAIAIPMTIPTARAWYSNGDVCGTRNHKQLRPGLGGDT